MGEQQTSIRSLGRLKRKPKESKSPRWRFSLGTARYVTPEGNVIASITLSQDAKYWSIDGTQITYRTLRAACEYVESDYLLHLQASQAETIH